MLFICSLIWSCIFPVKFVYLQQVFQPDMAVDWDNSCSTFLEFWIDTLYKRCQCLGYISQKCDLISKGFLYHSCVVNVDFFHEILVAFADRYADQLGRLVPWPGIWACNNASACLISLCRHGSFQLLRYQTSQLERAYLIKISSIFSKPLLPS